MSTQETTLPNPPKGRRRRWVIWLLSSALLLGTALLVVPMLLTSMSLGGSGAVQMVAAQYTPRDVVGDLGGMPVIIARHMAEFVEYEGDPGWGEQRKGPRPERTHASKLTSFGVQFRYPDMATLSSPEMWKDKKSKNIYQTDWMSFGVTTGNRYPGNGFLDRFMVGMIHGGGYTGDQTYRQQPPEHGLDVYVLDSVSPNSGKPHREDGDDWFFAKNAQGHLIADIRCSNVPHEAAPCRHNFSLEFNGVAAQVDVSYRRGMLVNWQDIQRKVTAMILGFRAQELETTPRPAEPLGSR
jgi:hypothetical protein